MPRLVSFAAAALALTSLQCRSAPTEPAKADAATASAATGARTEGSGGVDAGEPPKEDPSSCAVRTRVARATAQDMIDSISKLTGRENMKTSGDLPGLPPCERPDDALRNDIRTKMDDVARAQNAASASTPMVDNVRFSCDDAAVGMYIDAVYRVDGDHSEVTTLIARVPPGASAARRIEVLARGVTKSKDHTMDELHIAGTGDLDGDGKRDVVYVQNVSKPDPKKAASPYAITANGQQKVTVITAKGARSTFDETFLIPDIVTVLARDNAPASLVRVKADAFAGAPAGARVMVFAKGKLTLDAEATKDLGEKIAPLSKKLLDASTFKCR